MRKSTAGHPGKIQTEVHSRSLSLSLSLSRCGSAAELGGVGIPRHASHELPTSRSAEGMLPFAAGAAAAAAALDNLRGLDLELMAA